MTHIKSNWRTTSTEDFLKAVYKLETEGSNATTVELANELSIAPSSVTDAAKRIAKEEPALIRYLPYHGVQLTSVGKKVALQMVRRHRLIELLLYKVLGFSWDQVHAQAEELEHSVSDLFIDKLEIFLGYPTLDPHGDPIPSKKGTITQLPLLSLSQLSASAEGIIKRVGEQKPSLLRYLREKDIVLESKVKIVSLKENGVEVLVKGNKRFLPTKVANTIFVQTSLVQFQKVG